MDDESYHPKDDETTSVPWVSRLNILISDKVTSEMIRSLNIKQIVIFQVANKWARGELGNLIQNQNTELGWYILQKAQGLENLIFYPQLDIFQINLFHIKVIK